MNQVDYWGAGFHVFGMHSVTKGLCDCGNPDCQALYKHPRVSNWQYTPHWEEAQLAVMEETNQFKTGFGVLCDGWLIIDIDPRNGGSLDDFKSYYNQSGFVVATGGGGWHIYFRLPKSVALVSHLNQFKGVDFKSSGFVVGAGSLHASGLAYEVEKGHPEDITDAPAELIELLTKKDRHRASVENMAVDVTDSELRDMLSHIDPNMTHDDWVKIGMAIHHSTQGEGFDLWDEWSAKGDTYDSKIMDRKWHSFGKSANPVTLGTLLHYAEEGGYIEPVTFEPSGKIETNEAVPASLTKEMMDCPFDPCRPPGLAGKICDWINKNSLNLRENLAVGAALYTIGSLATCNYKDASYGGTPNLYITCVAESGSGKEGIIKAIKNLFSACGMGRRVHATMKSEQEIVRNLIADSKSFYRIDEFGEFIAKIDDGNAPPYLRGIKPQLLSCYSLSGGSYELGGDLLRETEESLKKTIGKLQKIVDNNEDKEGKVQQRLDREIEVLRNLDDGIQDFFISLIGFAAPNKFYEGVNYDSVVNGFVGRCMFFIERDGNPNPRRRFVPDYEIPMPMHLSLMGVLNGHGDIKTDSKADDAMQEVITYFIEMADTGAADSVAPIWRRGIELVIKVSLILAIPTGVRTFEHVAWAFNLVRKEVESRVNIAISNIASEDKERTGEALMRKILSKITKDHGETVGVLKSKCGVKYAKADVEKAIALLAQDGRIVSKKSENKKGPKSEKWYIASA